MIFQVSSDQPIYQQTFDAFKGAILRGELAAGAKLPSSRKQAETLGISRNTVLLAYDQLIAEGYAETKQGSGTFVREDLTLPSSQGSLDKVEMLAPNLSAYSRAALSINPGQPHAYPTSASPLPYDLRYGLISFDVKLMTQWKRHLAKATQHLPFNYGDVQGYLGLRQSLSEYLKQHRGVTCTAEQIIITGGSQQALYLSARAVLEQGDGVLLEDPCYQGASQIFSAQGVRIISAQIDSEGIVIPQEPTQSIKLAYTTPSHQFPSGTVMSLQRRLELLEWAKNNSVYILEDDYDSEYRYEGKPIPAIHGMDTHGCVIYMGTFSKTLFPSLRIGFVVLPDALVKPFRAIKWLIDRQNAALEQVALSSFIGEGQFERHIRRTRKQHAKNRQVLLEALEKHFGDRIEIVGSNAGIHLVVWFKQLSAKLEQTVLEKSQEAGVGVYPISPYYRQKPKRLGFLIGYTSLTANHMSAAVSRLAKVIAEFS